MDDKLDQQSFDQFIKESFEDFQVPYDPSSWSSMEKSLEAINLTSDENQSLDDFARNTLSNLNVPYVPSTWSSLENTMEKENLTSDENHLVDEQARNSLSDLTVPYVPSTWVALSDRLERMDYNQKLLALKVVEFAVFILAILTFVRILHQIPAKQESPAPQIEREFAYEMGENTQKLELTATIKENKSGDKTASTGQDQSAQNISSIPPKNSDRDQNDQISDKQAAIVPLSVPVDRLILDNPLENTAPSIYKSRMLTAYEALFIEAREIRIKNVSPVFDLRPVSYVEEITYQNPQVVTESYRYAKIPLVGLINQKAKIQTKIGLFSQMNIHRVNYINNRYEDRELVTDNVGFGMMTNVQFGKLGFDFGLGYEKLNYTHNPDNHLIHKLQAPIHLKFIPVRNKYFNMYLKAGAVFNGALYAKYNEPFLSLAPGSPGTTKDDPKYNDGLLNGGTLQNNFYIASSVGLGFESTVYNQISFFTEGLYQNHMSKNGISIISSDRFTTISINLGVIYTF